MSANCDFVSIHCTWIFPLRTCSRKWWYLIAMCLVRGRIFGAATNSTHPLLSSKTVECAVVFPVLSLVSFAISASNVCIGMISRIACDKVMYSASVVDNAISTPKVLDSWRRLLRTQFWILRYLGHLSLACSTFPQSQRQRNNLSVFLRWVVVRNLCLMSPWDIVLSVWLPCHVSFWDMSCSVHVDVWQRQYQVVMRHSGMSAFRWSSCTSTQTLFQVLVHPCQESW